MPLTTLFLLVNYSIVILDLNLTCLGLCCYKTNPVSILIHQASELRSLRENPKGRGKLLLLVIAEEPWSSSWVLWGCWWWWEQKDLQTGGLGSWEQRRYALLLGGSQRGRSIKVPKDQSGVEGTSYLGRTSGAHQVMGVAGWSLCPWEGYGSS